MRALPAQRGRRLSKMWRGLRREFDGQCRPETAFASRVRETCGDGARSSRASFLEFPADAYHFDGGRSGLKALVAALNSGAVERLLQSLAGEHAKAVRDAGFLLRLPDAACDLGVDGLVVSGFSAQQTPQRNDGVHTTGGRAGASRGGYLPCAGNAHNLDVGAGGAAAQERVESAIEQA